ncbi:MAG TPA: DUF1648 domain-containing protein [Candidatus Babeliales bacterium]|nr:DUF1648 domain-containing protein [Candidatus Babeliales bacterium]
MNKILIAAGAVIIIGTVVTTAARYRELPDRIPIHFGLDGSANRYGPRSAIWILVATQLLIASTYALTGGEGGLGSLITNDCILAIAWYAQLQIISAAITGQNRINPLRFWIFFAVMMAAGIAATRFRD